MNSYESRAQIQQLRACFILISLHSLSKSLVLKQTTYIEVYQPISNECSNLSNDHIIFSLLTF